MKLGTLFAMAAVGCFVFGSGKRVPRGALSRATPGPAADAPGTRPDASAGPRSDSPNAAERLDASGIATTRHLRWFDSTSQRDAEPDVPGLPDFSRGA